MALFENDGCTLFPDGTWRSCCDVHDQAFATGTTVQQFLSANEALFGCVWQHDPVAAVIMFVGVMTLGIPFFFLGRKKKD